MMLYKPPKRSILNPFNLDTGYKWERRLRWMYIIFAWNALGGLIYLKWSGKFKKIQEADAYSSGDGERTGAEELKLVKQLRPVERYALQHSGDSEKKKIMTVNWYGQKKQEWTLQDTKNKLKGMTEEQNEKDQGKSET